MSESLRYAVASRRDGEHVIKTATRGQAQSELERLEAEQRKDHLQRKKHAPEPGAIIPHPGYTIIELPTGEAQEAGS